ncbi:MAG: DUF2062 domain-containing protein [Pseudomonadota bacterium]
MRKFLSKYLPCRERVLRTRCLGRFTHLLHHHELWHFHRRSLAGGLALGLFIASTPLLGHVPLVLIGALLLRVNIPAAVGAALLTNPLTMPPFYYFAFRVGETVTHFLGLPLSAGRHLDLMQLINNWHNLLSEGGRQLWSAYLITWIGSLLIGILAAATGYYLTLVGWRLAVVWRWRRRQRARRLPPKAV